MLGVDATLRVEADADSLVRCSPGEDATNGFFVSLFIRGETDVSEPETKKRKEPANAHDNSEQRAAKRKKKKPSKAMDP